MASESPLTPIPWETRNLGRESFEITGEQAVRSGEEGLRDALKEKAQAHGRVFVQARIGKSEFHTVEVLEKIGFRFVETVVEPWTQLAKNPVLQRFNASPGDFLPRRDSHGDWSTALHDRGDQARGERVKAIAQESFVADRFHMDPQCDGAVANRRFAHWTDDLLADDRVVFHLMSRGQQTEGFLARRAEDLVLAGFSRRYASQGLGDFLWLSVLGCLAAEGATQARTVISAHNVPVLNLYARLAFKFRNPATTLHLWIG